MSYDASNREKLHRSFMLVDNWEFDSGLELLRISDFCFGDRDGGGSCPMHLNTSGNSLPIDLPLSSGSKMPDGFIGGERNNYILMYGNVVASGAMVGGVPVTSKRSIYAEISQVSANPILSAGVNKLSMLANQHLVQGAHLHTIVENFIKLSTMHLQGIRDVEPTYDPSSGHEHSHHVVDPSIIKCANALTNAGVQPNLIDDVPVCDQDMLRGFMEAIYSVAKEVNDKLFSLLEDNAGLNGFLSIEEVKQAIVCISHGTFLIYLLATRYNIWTQNPDHPNMNNCPMDS